MEVYEYKRPSGSEPEAPLARLLRLCRYLSDLSRCEHVLSNWTT
jgi:hypothetical protein